MSGGRRRGERTAARELETAEREAKAGRPQALLSLLLRRDGYGSIRFDELLKEWVDEARYGERGPQGEVWPWMAAEILAGSRDFVDVALALGGSVRDEEGDDALPVLKALVLDELARRCGPRYGESGAVARYRLVARALGVLPEIVDSLLNAMSEDLEYLAGETILVKRIDVMNEDGDYDVVELAEPAAFIVLDPGDQDPDQLERWIPQGSSLVGIEATVAGYGGRYGEDDRGHRATDDPFLAQSDYLDPIWYVKLRGDLPSELARFGKKSKQTHYVHGPGYVLHGGAVPPDDWWPVIGHFGSDVLKAAAEGKAPDWFVRHQAKGRRRRGRGGDVERNGPGLDLLPPLPTLGNPRPRHVDRVEVRWCSMAQKDHDESPRQYAHTFHRKEPVVCVCREWWDLPRGYRDGIMAHEVGHFLAGPRGSERAADDAFRDLSGHAIGYRDGRWGDRLQWIDEAASRALHRLVKVEDAGKSAARRNPDADSRKRERAASSGAVEEEARWIASRIRSGELDRGRVLSAAALGSRAAAEALGWAGRTWGRRDYAEVRAVLETLGPEVALSWGADVLEHADAAYAQGRAPGVAEAADYARRVAAYDKTGPRPVRPNTSPSDGPRSAVNEVGNSAHALAHAASVAMLPPNRGARVARLVTFDVAQTAQSAAWEMGAGSDPYPGFGRGGDDAMDAEARWAFGRLVDYLLGRA